LIPASGLQFSIQLTCAFPLPKDRGVSCVTQRTIVAGFGGIWLRSNC
jgi:hypothetical protein